MLLSADLFGPAATFPVGAAPRAMAAADLDGDGHADVVTTDAEIDEFTDDDPFDGTTEVIVGLGTGSGSSYTRAATTVDGGIGGGVGVRS